MKLTIRRDDRHILSDDQPTGYRLVPGSFQHSGDDKIGRWYIDRLSNDYTDKRGPGYRTHTEALEALRELLALEALSL